MSCLSELLDFKASALKHWARVFQSLDYSPQQEQVSESNPDYPEIYEMLCALCTDSSHSHLFLDHLYCIGFLWLPKQRTTNWAA